MQVEEVNVSIVYLAFQVYLPLAFTHLKSGKEKNHACSAG